MSLTKAQQIRKFQAARRFAIAHGDDFAKTFEKYDPSQPRDQRGRWTETGATGASASTRRHGDGIRSNAGARAYANVTVNNGWGPAIATGLLTAGGAALLLRGRGLGGVARRIIGGGPKVPPVLGGAAARAAGIGGAAARQARMGQTRIRPAATTKPPLGGKPTVKPSAAAGTITTKPYGELGRRQQLRREDIVRADALRRGATPAQADNLVAQMRARAAASSTSGLAQARPGATITTPAAVALERSRIADEVARHRSLLAEYHVMVGMGVGGRNQYNELLALERSVAAREKALGITQGFKFPKPPPPSSKKRLGKAVPAASETGAHSISRVSAGSVTATYKPNTIEPPKTGFGSITYKVDGGRSTTILKYREDQRRDQGGRFADEGKGDAGGRSVASFNRHTAGLGNISTEAQARAYTQRANEQLAAMQRLPSNTWRDPDVLDKAWGAYIKTMGAVALVGGALAGGVRIIGTPNAVSIYYGLLGLKVTGKRLGQTLSTVGNLLYRLGSNWRAAGHGLLSLAAFGAAKWATPGQSLGAYASALSWNSAVLSQLSTMPRTKAFARALLTQVSLPRLYTAGKVAAATGALLATAQGLRYGYRMIQSHGEYRGTDETNRRLETIEQHILALRQHQHG